MDDFGPNRDGYRGSVYRGEDGGPEGTIERLTRAVNRLSARIEKVGCIMASAIKDAADSVKLAMDNLATAVDAVVAAYQSGNPTDLADAITELGAAKNEALASAAEITAALPAPPPVPAP